MLLIILYSLFFPLLKQRLKLLMLKPGNIKISYTKLPRLAATAKKEKNILACSRLSVSGGLKKRAGDEWGLVGKKERSGEPVSIVLKTSFRYTSSWYTLWLVTFDSLYQHLVCLSEAKWHLTGRTWYTRVISSSPNLLKRSEWSKERVWSIWPLDRCFCHYS